MLDVIQSEQPGFVRHEWTKVMRHTCNDPIVMQFKF